MPSMQKYFILKSDFLKSEGFGIKPESDHTKNLKKKKCFLSAAYLALSDERLYM